MLRAAVNRLLHEPTQRLRALDGERRHARLQLLRELFGLEEPAAAVERPRRRGPRAALAVERAAARARAAARSRSRRRAGSRRGSAGRSSSWRSRRPATSTAARGDKSRWTGALERALLRRRDRPRRAQRQGRAGRARGRARRSWPCRAREDPRDVLVGAPSLDALPRGARVGTSALRRRAQLLAVRPDLDVVELRGNVDTRLRKLAAGEVDALVLAAAGLRAARARGRGRRAARGRRVRARARAGLPALQARGGRRRCAAAVDDARGAGGADGRARGGGARSAPPATRRSASTPRAGGRARLRRAAGRLGVAASTRRRRRRPRSRSGCSPRAPPTCSRARRRAARDRLPRRRRPGRSRAC